MAEARHPYAGRNAVLATMHGKEEAIAPALLSGIGLRVVPASGLDTDQLGTFSGEIARVGAMGEVAVRKARLGMIAAGLPLGLASEGTFGPHPLIPFLRCGMEVLVFIDDERGITVSESLVTEATNHGHFVVAPGEVPESFLGRIGFPSHALIIRPNVGEPSPALAKGVVDLGHLVRAIKEAAAASSDGRAMLETDMRAHLNPTRMKSLAMLAERLAERLAMLCPLCSTPGLGLTGTRAGLRCKECGAATEMIAVEIFGCVACHHREERGRHDGLMHAEPVNCPACNP